MDVDEAILFSRWVYIDREGTGGSPDDIWWDLCNRWMCMMLLTLMMCSYM